MRACPMPEGDTIFKLAEYLGPALTGRVLGDGSRVSMSHAELAGQRVGAVFAHGKHLFIEIGDVCVLRNHLGMWGSWHGYRPDEAWHRPARRASIVLDVVDRVYVCFNAREVELLRSRGVRQRILGRYLGPDLLATSPAFESMPQRARQRLDGATPLADVLLDQRVATGIGNVYKSEVLYVTRQHPQTRLDATDDATLDAIYRAAADLLAANVHGGPRITRRANDEAGILWVYGRTAQPCLSCDTPIVSARVGRRQRSTFWCPRCQPAATG